MDEEKKSLFTNKKFLIFVAVLIILGLLAYFVFHKSPADISEEELIETNSSSTEEYFIDTENYAATNHPISSLLPIINHELGYSLSYLISIDENEEYYFVLTIDYRTAEGRAAAEALLNSSEFTEYNPSKYDIVYTKLDEE